MAAQVYREPKPFLSWSAVAETPIVREKLDLLTTTAKILKKEGYIFEPLTEQELWRKMRCIDCGQRLKSFRPHLFPGTFSQQGRAQVLDDRDHYYRDRQTGTGTTAQEQHQLEVVAAATDVFQQRHYCSFHDGDMFKNVWQCCGGRAQSSGCCSNPSHTPCELDALRDQWKFLPTPAPSQAQSYAALQQPVGRGRSRAFPGNRGGRQRYNNTNNYQTPAPSSSPYGGAPDIRTAVALDCEMGTPKKGTSLDSVLIKLSLVDLFTGEALVNKLVAPTVDMLHYNTRFSGVTFAAMRNAKRRGEAIRGLDRARQQVFRYVDANTIVVVHGGDGDFRTLRWIHPADKIIDTHVLEGYDHKIREAGLKRNLKDTCMRRCGMSVQDAKLSNGRNAGHDSLEDAMACREIVISWLRVIPED